MPSISYRRAEGPYALLLELAPPVADHMAEAVCDAITDPRLRVANNGKYTPRLQAESASDYNIQRLALRVDRVAYPGEAVEIVNLQ